MEETHLPVYGVFVSLADVGNRSSHNVVGGSVDVVPMVRMHSMVYYGRMMYPWYRSVMRGVIQPPCSSAVHIPRVDAVVILRRGQISIKFSRLRRRPRVRTRGWGSRPSSRCKFNRFATSV